jgi:hypothetical protein
MKVATVKTPPQQKKADVIELPKAFHHVGLLLNEPPDTVGLLFIQSSDDSELTIIRNPLA